MATASRGFRKPLLEAVERLSGDTRHIDQFVLLEPCDLPRKAHELRAGRQNAGWPSCGKARQKPQHKGMCIGSEGDRARIGEVQLPRNVRLCLRDNLLGK